MQWTIIIKILTENKIHYLFIFFTLFVSCKEKFSQSLGQKKDNCTSYINRMDIFYGNSGNIDNILVRFKIDQLKKREYYYYLKYENKYHFLYYTDGRQTGNKNGSLDFYFSQSIFKAKSVKVNIPEINSGYYKITTNKMNEILDNIILNGTIVSQDINGKVISEYGFCKTSIVNVDQSKKNEFLKDGFVSFYPKYKDFK